MSHRVRARALSSGKKTPIERIFERVMHRKMTSQERVYFHLKRKLKPPRRTAAPRQTRAA